LAYKEIDPFDGNPRKVAEEGEKPDFLMGPGNFTPLHPEFFKDVIMNREEARAKFCTVKPEPQFAYENKKLTPVEITPNKSQAVKTSSSAPTK
jgi:hypothetical protein